MKAKQNYCPHCGKPMTEEDNKSPVDAVIEALEAMRGEDDKEDSEDDYLSTYKRNHEPLSSHNLTRTAQKLRYLRLVFWRR